MFPFVSGGGAVDEIARIGAMLNRFDIMVEHGRGLYSGGLYVADEFEDSTGIDATASTGETYNAAGYVHNPAGQVEIDRTLGTNIGDMTGDGGLVAAFNGNTTDNPTNRARAATSATGFVGKDYGLGNEKVINGVTMTRIQSGTGGSITTSLYASNSAPANATDGTLLKSFGAVSGGGNASDLSLPNTTAYRYVWSSLNDGSGAEHIYLNELQLYQASSPAALDIRSVSITLPSSPAGGFLVGRFSESNPDTVEASSDGGVTFQPVTVTDYGDNGSGVSVLAGPVALTGGGVDLRLRATKASGTECRIHAMGGIFK